MSVSCLGLVSVLWPFNTSKVISGGVCYSNQTVPEQACLAVYQYLVHILSPITDICSSWISGRGRMDVEIFHDQVSMKDCAGCGDRTQGPSVVPFYEGWQKNSWTLVN